MSQPRRLLDASGRPLPQGVGMVVRAMASGVGTIGDSLVPAAYDAGSQTDPMMADVATMRSPDRAWLPHRNTSVARVRALHRNDPVAKSAVKRKRTAAVGKGWRLSSRPDYRALGISIEQARELGAAIETEFRPFAYGHDFQIDAERQKNLGQLLGLIVSHDMIDGEALGLVEYADDEPTRYRTRLRIVHPDRLSNPTGKPNSPQLAGGVERNAAGVPVRYWIRERHPSELGVATARPNWTGYDRFTPWGRPQVLHTFDCEEAGQTRGVSRFAASLKSFRALSRFTDATLQAATINALMVAFIKSSAGPDAVSESLSMEDIRGYESSREGFYDKHPVSLDGGARMPVLPFGDEIQMQTGAKDVSQFDAFIRAVIRLIAASLGVTYEELTMDYSQTNYSSARAAMIPAWNETQELVARLEAQIVKPLFVAWLEEAFDSGYVEMPAGAPDFYDAVDAYAQSRWIGPGRGFIDPTKEIDAAAARIEAKVSTLEDECAEQGKDWEEVLEQQAREKARRAELELDTQSGALARAAETSRDPAHNAALAERAA
ncbi:phage portal protein [Brevundimonas sp.]|uniref:phage portal protein n=1 Tax=Brevundimonas sp. TaxID=1871086 RepID=UPI002D4C38A7|nr:phage portal protein [Brevundimonas sp.]HYD26978.1 phage portal protein [Brevundimonas sp.]